MIQCKSAGFDSGNYAKISMNDFSVEVERNYQNHYRGLHIVVINPNNGKVESANVFDTYESSKHLDIFIKTFIPNGYIVVAACKDDCAT